MKKQVYLCSECGYETAGWLGKCPSCGQFNTFALFDPKTKESKPKSIVKPQPITSVQEDIPSVTPVSFYEIARVLGGGIFPGQVILMGGEPGIGKSTLVLQLAYDFAMQGKRVLYNTGEESALQVQQRARRLGVLTPDLFIFPSRQVEEILEEIQPFDLVIVDSLQTLLSVEIPQAAGSIAQVRACAEKLTDTAKEKHVPLLFISHVTKEGGLAGPKLVEHIVDTVLYLEGDRTREYRILRGVKNRFGSTNELAILEMTRQGLVEVKNPSSYFLSEQREQAGSCIVPVREGINILFLEIQALVTPSPFQIPKRNTQGITEKRLSQIIAVLEKKAQLRLFNRDLFVNCVGGLQISDTGADLGVALSIASSYFEKPIPEGLVAVGELGLAGELRSVPQIEKRIKEAARLGFSVAIVPSEVKYKGEMEIIKYRYLKEAIAGLKES